MLAEELHLAVVPSDATHAGHAECLDAETMLSGFLLGDFLFPGRQRLSVELSLFPDPKSLRRSVGFLVFLDSPPLLSNSKPGRFCVALLLNPIRF
jgi:hypothetical protein